MKKLRLGFGSVFSLIVMYFIYKSSSDKGWGILAFISKWYLIIVGGLFILILAISLLVVILTLLAFGITAFKIRKVKKHPKKTKEKIIEADFEVRE